LKHVFVTGGTGFVAQALFPKLSSEDWNIRTTLRHEKQLKHLPNEVSGFVTGHFEDFTNWRPALEGINAVVHLAARVHHMEDDGSNSDKAYQEMNVEVTETLAEAAVKAKVKRFIFISSIKAMGEKTEVHEAWNESSPCKPQDAYGRSKYHAERALIDIAQKTGLEIVILRIPLVYGPGLKANMALLFRIVDRGFPLPLALVKNARSLLFVGNLVDAIRVTLDHPKAAGQTFLVSDGEDISTPELIRRIAHALGRLDRLLPLSPAILRWIGKLTRKSSTLDRLLNSLVIDNTRICQELNWTPPFSMSQGLQQTSEWFRKAKGL